MRTCFPTCQRLTPFILDEGIPTSGILSGMEMTNVVFFFNLTKTSRILSTMPPPPIRTCQPSLRRMCGGV